MIQTVNPTFNTTENSPKDRDVEISSLKKENASLKKEMDWLKEQMAALQKLLFGPKKTKLIPLDDQGGWLPGMDPKDLTQQPAQEQPKEGTVKAHTRKKPVRDGHIARLSQRDALLKQLF